ncbi:MAG: hypothetical protein JNN20_12350 [Betaproteobacteria bacterium]|nr:hypothetical protein [Betaproteobacteria bacterium]
MRVAFTSCIDAINDPEQKAWIALAAQQPEHILLMGDCIYMDYGMGDHLSNGGPSQLSLADFSAHMHASYARQWRVKNFRDAIRGRRVDAIWDDHDFAWNNGRGEGSGVADGNYVPRSYRRLSRALFQQFREVLRDRPERYPDNPHADGDVQHDLGGIQYSIDLAPDVRIHLTDGRSFREAPSLGFSLLGEAQWKDLKQALHPAIDGAANIIVSGTTMNDWRRYTEHNRLIDAATNANLLMLSGDIHEYGFNTHGRLFEATASAMAQPPGLTRLLGKKSEVFGILDIGVEALRVGLWHKGKEKRAWRIARETWVAMPAK